MRWQELGWEILIRELPRQVFADGVDFEASTAYHRLVLELFFLPACYRQSQGLAIPATYQQLSSKWLDLRKLTLVKMAPCHFVAMRMTLGRCL